MLRILFVFSVTFHIKYSLFSISICIFAQKYIDYIFRNKTMIKNIGKPIRTRLLNLKELEQGNIRIKNYGKGNIIE